MVKVLATPSNLMTDSKAHQAESTSSLQFLSYLSSTKNFDAKDISAPPSKPLYQQHQIYDTERLLASASSASAAGATIQSTATAAAQ